MCFFTNSAEIGILLILLLMFSYIRLSLIFFPLEVKVFNHVKCTTKLVNPLCSIKTFKFLTIMSLVVFRENVGNKRIFFYFCGINLISIKSSQNNSSQLLNSTKTRLYYLGVSSYMNIFLYSALPRTTYFVKQESDKCHKSFFANPIYVDFGTPLSLELSLMVTTSLFLSCADMRFQTPNILS